jgi:phage tail protein X
MALNRKPGTCSNGYPAYTRSCPGMRGACNYDSKIIKYVIQPGDTLCDLAYRFNTTVEAIMEINPGIDPSNLRIGQVILIPDPPFGPGFGFGPWFGFGPGFGFGPWFGFGPFGPWI